MTHYAPPTQPTRKPLWKRWWVWLIAAIVLLIVVAAAHGGDDSGGQSVSAPAPAPKAADKEPPTPAPAPVDEDPLSDGGWTASDIQTKRTPYGDSITARVTNTNTKTATRTGVFTLTVFSGGQRIYEAVGSARDVEAGQAATVTFVGTTEKLPGDPAGYTYELQADL